MVLIAPRQHFFIIKKAEYFGDLRVFLYLCRQNTIKDTQSFTKEQNVT